MRMHKYELHPGPEGLRLTGGPLQEPLDYPANDRAAAIHVVGFLSQRDGSILDIFDAGGQVVETQRREPSGVQIGAVGGLRGPT